MKRIYLMGLVFVLLAGSHIILNISKKTSKEIQQPRITITPTVCPPPPGEYLLRSSCPFTSASINNECRVICPISKDNTCSKDSDCDCSHYQSIYSKERFDCHCVDSKCVIAVNKADIKNWP